MQWVPSLRAKALWDRKVRKLIGLLLGRQETAFQHGVKSMRHPFPNYFPPRECAARAKKRRTVMVPVNGTRVGRGEERKRSEVHLSLDATGTATFDKSAMSRLRKDE
jgi:hypothetical protein